jgi:hypothetical protein
MYRFFYLASLIKKENVFISTCKNNIFELKLIYKLSE